MSQTVFVSGATGFIAQHIVKQLLAEGYNVIGSVRSEAKGEDLKQLAQSDKFKYVVVPDIIKEGAFDKALIDNPEVSVFLHTASPVVIKTTDVEKELLNPAVEGTKNALFAIKAHGKNVKNVVVTSSVVTMFNSVAAPGSVSVINEESFNQVTREDTLKNPDEYGYPASKTLAEHEVWNFVKQEKPHFSVATIHPTYVFGPQAYEVKDKSQLNFSSEEINKILKLKPDDKLPAGANPFTDVRDVTKAHLLAFQHPEKFNNKRVLLKTGFWTNELIAYVINEHFSQLSVPKGNKEKSDEQLKNAPPLDDTKSRELLGFEYIPLEKSIIDSVQQIVEAK